MWWLLLFVFLFLVGNYEVVQRERGEALPPDEDCSPEPTKNFGERWIEPWL